MTVYDCPQYSDEWWALRRGVPTASEFGCIITPAKGELSKQAETYACRLIADKYDAFYGRPEEYVSAAMKNGSIMEPEARRFYEFERDVDVRQVGFCLTDDGRFGCSPDGLVGDDGGLELKTPQPHTHVKYLLDGVLPLDYRPQVHGAMAVTGRDWWDFMSYSAGLPKLLVRVERDDYTKRLQDALEEFWPLYQGMLNRIEAGRQEAIEEAIARNGDQLPDDLRGLVPADSQFEPQPF